MVSPLEVPQKTSIEMTIQQRADIPDAPRLPHRRQQRRAQQKAAATSMVFFLRTRSLI
jgi:hypothetical protein